MNNNEFFYLVINKIKSHGFRVRAINGDKNFAGVSIPKLNIMAINLNYERPKRLSLIALHEYGHLILHTDCLSYNNFKLEDEAKANKVAVNTLLHIYWEQWPCDCDVNSYFNNMAQVLDIPWFLFDDLQSAAKNKLLN